MSERVLIYDTTLRDGMQREGLSLSAGEQLAVAVRLAEFGVHYLEAGFPASNPKYGELFGLLEREDLGATRVAAFGMTRRRGVGASEDPAVRGLAECFAPVITIVGKTWDLHLQKVIKVDRAENLRMIEESVAFLARQGKEVVYDAEHFFDAYLEHPDYALDCLRAAEAGGASWLTPCDTNGATLPNDVSRVIREVRAAIPGTRIGIHTHNDAECGVANSLAAIAEGARMVQGTINGYGERCGNANLISIIPSLTLKMGFETIDPEKLNELTGLSHWVAETVNLQPDAWAAYVGRNAFAHKGGMHVAAMGAEVTSYEHIDPGLVGNERQMLVSELSGRGTILAKAREMGIDVEDPGRVQAILARLKDLEHQGYHFEVADASFELLLERETGLYEPLFVLESYRVSTEKRADGHVETEATVKLVHQGERIVEVAEGNGPVNAIDRALRKALEGRVPELADIDLVNFKVRILDETKGTDAITRVLVESSDGHERWGTIGVHANVIEASWEALLDSLEHGVRRAARSSAPAA
ncbi:MAG: 2-isopropylmalate synthase [Miltoncostaeaceae bacterium]|nr:2-isopropylmalate synthase [Miltoncostaeaceae bacterium]